MGERALRWLLFGVMTATAPALYFLFVVGGFLPLAYIAWMTVLDPSLWIANLIHLAIWGAIFYGVAWLAAKLLARLPQIARVGALAVLCGGLVWTALQPIYGVGHHQTAGVSVYRLFVKPSYQQPMAVTPSAPKPVLAPSSGTAASAPRPAK
jgi:hypothetical protein